MLYNKKVCNVAYFYVNMGKLNPFYTPKKDGNGAWTTVGRDNCANIGYFYAGITDPLSDSCGCLLRQLRTLGMPDAVKICGRGAVRSYGIGCGVNDLSYAANLAVCDDLTCLI